MSLKYEVVLLCVICLSYEVVMTACEVVLVNRNVTDSFRVGKDGCTNNTSVCPSSSTCQPDSGLCLCGHPPNFRNPDPKTGDGKLYGCMSNLHIRSGLGFGLHCHFKPFQLIPYSHNGPATQFNQPEKMKSCLLSNNKNKKKAQAKFPNITNDVELQWLDESYVHFSVSNNILNFKWKRSVPGLRGAIITLYICCSQDRGYVGNCLRAKVLGTWPPGAVSEPTVTSTQPQSSQITTNSNSPTTITTAKPKSTSSGSSGKECPDSIVSNTALIAVLAISLVANVVLGIVVAFLWKDRQSLQDSNLKKTEMQNIGEHTRANAADEISIYNVVVDNNMQNDENHDEPSPLSVENNENGRLSVHQYEEPSNYEPLRRNPSEQQNEHHHYQSLTPSQQRK